MYVYVLGLDRSCAPPGIARADQLSQANSYSNIAPPFIQNGAKSGFEMCLNPSTFGTGA